MLRRITYAVFVALGCSLVCLMILGGIALQFATAAAGGTLASGRTVVTRSDGWQLNSRFSNDTATIETSGHTIVVAPKQLIVDGALFAVIPEKVESVTVTVEDHEISFLADGERVAPPRR